MSSVDDDLERRLENWARWYGGQVPTLATASIYDFGSDQVHGHRRYSEAAMPVLNGEALDTDKAIRQLDGPIDTSDAAPGVVMLRRPLEAVLRARYLRLAPSGYAIRTLSEIQVASALYISYPTYWRRLCSARRELRLRLPTRA